MAASERSLVLSCEHASRRVPARWRHHLDDAALLDTHRVWDRGARELARRLARSSGAPLFEGEVSRLVVDLNRSPHHRQLHGLSGLSRAHREHIVARWYQPFRAAVAAAIDAARPALHLSIHSFTPVWNAQPRNIDIGLLYDPARSGERSLCVDWQRKLTALSGLRVRRNAPYRGTADGHTRALRQRWPQDQYLGIEIEISQALVDAGAVPRIAAWMHELVNCA